MTQSCLQKHQRRAKSQEGKGEGVGGGGGGDGGYYTSNYTTPSTGRCLHRQQSGFVNHSAVGVCVCVACKRRGVDKIHRGLILIPSVCCRLLEPEKMEVCMAVLICDA